MIDKSIYNHVKSWAIASTFIKHKRAHGPSPVLPVNSITAEVTNAGAVYDRTLKVLIGLSMYKSINYIKIYCIESKICIPSPVNDMTEHHIPKLKVEVNHILRNKLLDLI